MFGWRRPYHDWRLFVYYPLLAVLPVLVLLSSLGEEMSPSALIAVAVIALVMFCGWRTARQGIYVSTAGVRAQGLLRSTVLRWSEIASIDEGVESINFVTVDGRVVCSAVQPTSRAWDRFGPQLPPPRYSALVALLRSRLLGPSPRSEARSA